MRCLISFFFLDGFRHANNHLKMARISIHFLHAEAYLPSKHSEYEV